MRLNGLILAGTLLLGMALVAAAGDPTTKKLVGVWRPEKSQDTVEFTKDGKIIVQITAGGKAVAIEGKYEVKDGKVVATITLRGETNPKVDRFVFAIKRLTDRELAVEDLVTGDRKGKVETYNRVGK
jgi:uncharacterized protein (TIGR03066 family)